jgi:integrase
VRKDVLLGAYGSRESRAKYDRSVAEWLVRGRLPEPAPAPSASITIEELIARFWSGRVVSYYRHPDGSPTSEQENFRQALRSLRSMYGDLAAADFDAEKLEAWLVAVTRPTRTVLDPDTAECRQVSGWCRTNANKNLSRLKAMFKWGNKKKFVRPEVYAAVRDVEGLPYGRCDARETKPVQPVSEAFVDAIRPFLSSHLATMVQLQLHCGARPGELCSMRTSEIQTRGSLWWYYPARHKNAYRGHTRAVPLGPSCQHLLGPNLKPELDAYVFSPAEAERERLAALHVRRKTPNEQGNSPGTNRVDEPKVKPGERYTVAAYRRAIARACERAFPPPAAIARQKVRSTKRPKVMRSETDAEWRKRLGPEQWALLEGWRKQHHWHPHQLRHTAGTRAREEEGAEGAQAFLGHKHVKTTELYAARNAGVAAKVAAKIG